MFRRLLTITVLPAMLVACRTPTVEAASALSAAEITAGLRTANPDDEAYITYVVTLLNQERLSRKIVESTFQWARRKSHPRKFQYFKHGLITRAARIGIQLPTGTPALNGTIEGKVVLKVLFVYMPCPNITVTIEGAKRETVTDKNGRFSFAGVPFGTYTLDAAGTVLLFPLTGLAQVRLPTTPPSDEPAYVEIECRP